MNLFSDFGLLPSILDTLKEKKIFKPTEIQSQAIPVLMGGQSVVGVAETGSGKTITYAVPILQKLKLLETEGKNAVEEESAPRAVIMVPSRELGDQVAKVFKSFTHHTRLRVRPALGGMAFEHATRNTSGPFEILLATPGRLAQLLARDLVKLHDVRILIFDEADQMLDKDFLSDSEAIIAACPHDIQLAMFSATVSATVEALMNSIFKGAEVIRSSGSGKVVKSLVTQNRLVMDGKRWPVFESVLKQRTEGGTLIFTNTREQCDKLAQELLDKGYHCAVYRGDMDKALRKTNLKKFRNGEIDMLISTDLAARGLDIEHIGRVINYHLPQQMENYLHRAGRTARGGRPGLVVNLVTERDERLISKLEGKKITVPRPDRAPKEEEQRVERRPKTSRGKTSRTRDFRGSDTKLASPKGADSKTKNSKNTDSKEALWKKPSLREKSKAYAKTKARYSGKTKSAR